jgi:hypothetical protein
MSYHRYVAHLVHDQGDMDWATVDDETQAVLTRIHEAVSPTKPVSSSVPSAAVVGPGSKLSLTLSSSSLVRFAASLSHVTHIVAQLRVIFPRVLTWCCNSSLSYRAKQVPSGIVPLTPPTAHPPTNGLRQTPPGVRTAKTKGTHVNPHHVTASLYYSVWADVQASELHCGVHGKNSSNSGPSRIGQTTHGGGPGCDPCP